MIIKKIDKKKDGVTMDLHIDLSAEDLESFNVVVDEIGNLSYSEEKDKGFRFLQQLRSILSNS